jgi:hypothetical protein
MTLQEEAENIITQMGWDWTNTESSARRVAEFATYTIRETKICY